MVANFYKISNTNVALLHSGCIFREIMISMPVVVVIALHDIVMTVIFYQEDISNRLTVEIQYQDSVIIQTFL
jgi:hypothetical protein